MNALIPNVIGTLAALCSMGSFAPQVVKLMKEKDASGVSLRTYSVTVTAFVLWVIYGFALKSWPLIVSNGVCVGFSAVILGLKLKYGGDGAAAKQA